MFCTNCGNKLKESDEFCSKCGSRAKKIVHKVDKMEQVEYKNGLVIASLILAGVGLFFIIFGSLIFRMLSLRYMVFGYVRIVLHLTGLLLAIFGKKSNVVMRTIGITANGVILAILIFSYIDLYSYFSYYVNWL